MVTSHVVPFDTTQDVWARAMRRAQARPYQVKSLQCREYAGLPVWFFKVSSNSEPGNWHYVSVGRTLHDGWDATCDCKAGERNVVCVHAALVLSQMGVLNSPDPDAAAPPAAAPPEWVEAA